MILFSFLINYSKYKRKLFLNKDIVYDVCSEFNGITNINSDLDILVNIDYINIIFKNVTIVSISNIRSLDVARIHLYNKDELKEYDVYITDKKILDIILKPIGQYKIIQVLALSCTLNKLNKKTKEGYNKWIIKKLVNSILKRVNLEKLFQ